MGFIMCSATEKHHKLAFELILMTTMQNKTIKARNSQQLYGVENCNATLRQAKSDKHDCLKKTVAYKVCIFAKSSSMH